MSSLYGYGYDVGHGGGAGTSAGVEEYEACMHEFLPGAQARAPSEAYYPATVHPGAPMLSSETGVTLNSGWEEESAQDASDQAASSSYASAPAAAAHPPAAHPAAAPPASSSFSETKQAVVNGIGVWESFQRNFRSAQLAMLDLFDNAMDATLRENYSGRISMFRDYDATMKPASAHSICMLNNCEQVIPPLHKVLEVFGSSKETTEIGENGVGIKQACAALSDLSIVITKNRSEFQIGFICKALQHDRGCCLPSYTLRKNLSVHDALCTLMNGCRLFEQCMLQYDNRHHDDGDANTNVDAALARLERHIQSMKNNTDDDYVFLVIMHNVHERRNSGGITAMLESLRTELPRQYLHIPPHFNVIIDGTKVTFQHWERHLVELHHFALRIDPQHTYKTACDWMSPGHGNRIELFIGFDAVRARDPKDNKACLLVYSRKSGRLVKETTDARGDLFLNNSGTEFAQGLTIIVDDRRGSLPVTPTKQDLAFGQEPNGKWHELNLYTWVGAFAHLYYKHFLERVGGKKGDLTAEIAKQSTPIEAYGTTLLSLDAFSTFRTSNFTKMYGAIRCVKHRKDFAWIQRDGTRIQIAKREAPPRETSAAATTTATTVTPDTPTSSGKRARLVSPQAAAPKRLKTTARKTRVADDATEEETMMAQLLQARRQTAVLTKKLRRYKAIVQSAPNVNMSLEESKVEAKCLRKSNCRTRRNIGQLRSDLQALQENEDARRQEADAAFQSAMEAFRRIGTGRQGDNS